MKYFACLTVIIILSQFAGFSQGCLPEGINFWTQEQIDNFQTDYPGCTEIEGDVEINGNYITNLNGLIVLESINGTLEIFSNNQLVDLTGLDSLIYIGNRLEIHHNLSLETLNGLNSLSYIGSFFDVLFNNSLISLAGLESLETVGDNCLIFSNNHLTNIGSLNNIITFDGALSIAENPELKHLNGFKNLENVGISLTFWDNAKLSDLNDLSTLNSIGSNLYIEYNPSLKSLSGLSNVNSIGALLYICSNDSLTGLSGLENIDPNSIVDLTIIGNPELLDCDVQSICEYLVSPNGTIEIHDNAPGCNTQQEVEEACLVEIPENNGQPNISIYPNPAKNELFISGGDGFRIYEVKIYNPIGEIVLHRRGQIQYLDVSLLHCGLYMIEVIMDNTMIRTKLLKQ